MRPTLVVLALALSGLAVPSASAAPCDGDYRLEGDCWVDYVQRPAGGLIGLAEGATGEDLSGVRVFFDWLVDRAQDEVRPVFDVLPDYIPCVSPGGPHCW